MAKIISVYFNGTCDNNDVPETGNISLAALLASITQTDDSNSYSFCVNGCGESRDIRDFGIVFSFHLEKQVLNIANQIENIMKESEEKITLNIYGFSRGGIAAFWLCQIFKHIPSERLTINVTSIDPVPVNFITSVYGDLLLGTHSTLSAAVADLSECMNIENMQVLFTNQPMPDIIGFAPLLPALPTSCILDIDVTPGRHETAVSFSKAGNSIHASNNESVLVFHRVVGLMQQCGTPFNFNQYQFNDNLISRDSLLNLYRELAQTMTSSSTRSMHLGSSIFTTASKPYLNRHHQRLSAGETTDDADCILTLKTKPLLSIGPQQRQVIIITQVLFALAMTFIIYDKFFNTHQEDNNSHFKKMD